ncbi:metaxin-2 isoform X1 [Ailuropoda melanoleuca]|uniref:Metaxin-2 n=2 Tax=Ursidae TaxID=9632 RepID=A0A7N5K584_AILME|nr:metaxin-2 isoform X1 [Ailuropoda melanoleuca]
MWGSIPQCQDHALSRRQTLNHRATQAPQLLILLVSNSFIPGICVLISLPRDFDPSLYLWVSQAFLQMCNLPIKVVCRANAEYMSPSGKVPFIHVGNQVVSELGPIVQFVKAKGHSLSDGLDEVQKAEMKAYMELVNNMLLTAELYLQWCDETTVGEITHARYGSPYPWPLNHILAYQKQWEVKRKMKAIGWGNKTLDQVLEDVDQCCQALSQRLGTQPYFFNKQPTELDALVFGHLYTILTTQLTNDELSEKVKNYSNLLAFCRRIEQHYFEDRGKGSSSIRSS